MSAYDGQPLLDGRAPPSALDHTERHGSSGAAVALRLARHPVGQLLREIPCATTAVVSVSECLRQQRERERERERESRAEERGSTDSRR